MAKKNVNTRKSTKGTSKYSNRPTKNNRDDFEDNSVTAGKGGIRNKGYVPKSYNDAAWYRRNPEALAAATKLSMNLAAGTPIYPALRDTINTEYGSPSYRGFPGVTKFEYVVALGASAATTDAINLAAQRLFKDLRKQNTGSTAYDPADLMMYILAMDQIYSLYAWMVRTYKTVNYYSSRNRNVPKVLLHAMDIDGSISEDLATFRYWLINFKARLDSWHVPGNIDFIKRHYWLNSHIYKDQDTEKAALFFFNQRYWLRYIEDPTQPDAHNFSLMPVYLTESEGSTVTFGNLANLMTDMLRDIETSQDFSIINGDILKVFSPNECFSVSVPSELDIITPYYDEEVCQQVRNALICGYPRGEDTATNGRIYQDYATGVVKQDLAVSPNVADLNPIITFNTDIPSEDDIMISTRLVPAITYDGSVQDKEKGVIHSAGSDIITALVTYRYNTVNNTITVNKSYGSVTNAVSKDLAETCTQVRVFPIYYIVNSAADSVTTHLYPIDWVVGDINNYTVMNKLQLRNLHETAMFSLFNVY